MAKQLAPLRRRAEAAYALPESKRMAAAASIWGDQIRIQVAFNRRLRAVGAPPGDAAARNLLAQLDRGVVLARRIQRRVRRPAASPRSHERCRPTSTSR